MSIENWVAVISAVIAFASLVLAWWKAVQAQRSQRESTKQAEASTRAAQQAADYQKQIAESLKKLEPKPAPPWRVELDRGESYFLTNTSGETLHNVHVELGGIFRIANQGKIGRVEPDGQIDFMYMSVSGEQSPRQVQVSWNQVGTEKRRSWSGRIPRPEKSK